MHPEQVLTGWDTFLLMAPFSALLAAWMFRLDEIAATPRKKHRRAFSLTNLNGRAAFTDPDGRPWKLAPKPSRPDWTSAGIGGKLQSGRAALR